MCDLPPCPPCPANTPSPCPQACPPPPHRPPCRPKPIMRGLHWAQTQRKIAQALAASMASGALVYFFLGRARRANYADFHRNADLEEWADEMARKGLFQAVPAASSEDHKG